MSFREMTNEAEAAILEVVGRALKSAARAAVTAERGLIDCGAPFGVALVRKGGYRIVIETEPLTEEVSACPS